MPNQKLFAALGPPKDQGFAAPGSPGIAAGPQIPDMRTQVMPDPNPAFTAFRLKNPTLDELTARNAFSNIRPSARQSLFPPQQQPPVDPYMNLANKVTGKEYK